MLCDAMTSDVCTLVPANTALVAVTLKPWRLPAATRLPEVVTLPFSVDGPLLTSPLTVAVRLTISAPCTVVGPNTGEMLPSVIRGSCTIAAIWPDVGPFQV